MFTRCHRCDGVYRFMSAAGNERDYDSTRSVTYANENPSQDDPRRGTEVIGWSRHRRRKACRMRRWHKCVFLRTMTHPRSRRRPSGRIAVESRTSMRPVCVPVHRGSMTVCTTANRKTATAKANATTRTLRCSNFPDALAKKSTVANKTVFARY